MDSFYIPVPHDHTQKLGQKFPESRVISPLKFAGLVPDFPQEDMEELMED
jgi:hypothetical protein